MNSSYQNRSWMVATMIMLAFIMTCGSKDPVNMLMTDLKEAVEARDVNDFEKRLAPGFSGNDEIGREEALALLRRYFAAYEKISVDVTNVERSKKGDRVNFRVSFSGKGNAAFNLQNLLPTTAAYYFELRLVEDGGMLKVQKAFWRQTSNF